jgi:hypothetical protein
MNTLNEIIGGIAFSAMILFCIFGLPHTAMRNAIKSQIIVKKVEKSIDKDLQTDRIPLP